MTSPATPIRFLLYPSLGEVKDHVRAAFLGRMLSARVGRPVILEMAPTYELVEQELLAGRVDMAWATADQCNHYEPQARAVLRTVRGGSWRYHSALICRADAPLDLTQLRGKRAAWVAPMSAGGYLLATRHLTSLGLPPEEVFSEQHFVGTYRKAMLAVLEGQVDVAAVFTSNPDEYTVRAFLAERVGAAERQLLPFAFTGSTLADGIILTHRLSEAESAVLVSALTSMRSGGAGQDLLVGLFDAEGFVLSKGEAPRAPVVRPAPRAEYLMVEVDDEGRCLRLWAPMGEAFGRQVRGNCEGRPLAEVVGAEAAAPLVTLARAVRYRGMGGRVEYRLDVGGEARWYTAEATEPPAGQECGTSLLVRNVTELRAHEESLYHMASFPQMHPDPLLELGLDGRLHYANAAAHLVFPDVTVLGAEHPVVEVALARLHGGSTAEAARPVALGGRHWELTVEALPDAERLRVFARDVTMRREMETRLSQTDRLAALGSMAAAVCHEMNNPLAFMLSNLSFAREELARLCEERGGAGGVAVKDLDEVREVMEETADGAERLKNIVQELRMLSRGPSPHGSRVNVHPVLEDALKLVRNELRYRVRLEKELHPVPMVGADEARLSQVFLNLLLNAVRSMPNEDAARNVLRVCTRTGPGGEAIIEFQDTGPGHSPEVLARIFEPFFSTNPSTAGLGLSVSHAIVTGLGGNLSAESRQGEGTTFTVTFPAAGPVSLPPRKEPVASDAEPQPSQLRRGAA
jgi:signal transduction histidine kinase/ABC-type phosphate/phosphonate transport system substrate-binding protein